MSFDPKIIAFCCRFCAYGAADLAGSMRLQYPDNIRIVLIPCTGKADIKHMLTAFENGADGVMVAGCLEGDCHFVTGNLRARKRTERARKILAAAGLEPERIEMFNLSSAMGPRFAEIVTEFTERITSLGPAMEPKANVKEARDMAEETT